MTWAYPFMLWGLFAVPLLVVGSFLMGMRSRKNMRALGRDDIEWQVRSFLRDFSMAAFFVLSLLAAAEPRSGRRPVTGERSGLDMAVAYDVSRSMKAEDLLPNRHERAVNALRQLSSTLVDARLSLIPFKGDAILAVPMTEDRVTLDLWIERLGPGISTVPGTNIEAALRTAVDSFPKDAGRQRTIVLITDGESLSGRIERVSRELAEAGIPVRVLAVGTSEGATIPLGNGDYVKDAAGRPVISKVNTAALKRLAEDTGGSYHELDRPGAAGELTRTIVEAEEFAESRGIRFMGMNRYRTFLLPALSFLGLYLFVRIFPWRKK